MNVFRVEKNGGPFQSWDVPERSAEQFKSHYIEVDPDCTSYPGFLSESRIHGTTFPCLSA